MQIYPEKYDKLGLSTSEKSFLRTLDRAFPEGQLAYYVLHINPRKKTVGQGSPELFNLLAIFDLDAAFAIKPIVKEKSPKSN